MKLRYRNMEGFGALLMTEVDINDSVYDSNFTNPL